MALPFDLVRLQQLADRVAQTGQLIVSGSYTYIDFTGGSAIDTYRTFASVSSGWTTGQIIPVVVVADATNLEVWEGAWDATNGRVYKSSASFTEGSIATGTVVSVYLSFTAAAADHVQKDAAEVEVTGSRSIADTDNGLVLRCTNASSITLTFPVGLLVPFHCLVLRENAAVILATDATSYLNFARDTIQVAAQYASKYVYMRNADNFIVVV